MCFYGLAAPAPAGTDIYIFKAAGMNWALGRGFTALAIPGMQRWGLQSHAYGSYVPGYVMLYGIFAKIFGASQKASTYYDLIIAIASIFVFYGILRRWLPSGWRWRVAALLALIMPDGYIYGGDRPETLAFLGFMLAVICADGGSRGLAAALAGLVACISPFAGILTGAGIWLVYMFNLDEYNNNPITVIKDTLRMAGIFFMPLAVLMLAYVWPTPGVMDEFFAHADGRATGIGVLLHQPFWHEIYLMIFSSGSSSMMMFAVYILTTLTIIIMNLMLWRSGDKKIKYWLLTVSGWLLAPFILFPHSMSYLAWDRGAAMALNLLIIKKYSQAPPLRRVLTAGLMLTCLLLAPWVAQPAIISWITRHQYAAAEANAKKFMRYEAKKHPGMPVAVPANAMFLYGRYGATVNPEYFKPVYGLRLPADSFAGEAVCTFFDQPGQKPPPLPGHPRLLLYSRPPGYARLRLLGRAIVHGSYQWQCANYNAIKGKDHQHKTAAPL